MAFQRLSVAIAAALFALLPTLALAQDPNTVAVPSNTSDYMVNNVSTGQLVIGILTSSSVNSYNVQPLSGKANSSVDHSQGANISNSPVGTGLTDARPQDLQNVTKNAPRGPIAYVSCDNATYTGNVNMASTVSQAISKTGNGGNASAVLFYSLSADFCNLSSSLSQQFVDYDMFYTTVSSNVSHIILGQVEMNSGAVSASIGTAQSFTNYMQTMGNNQNGFGSNIAGTNVAMIILYSITGVIALLFVVIIVTGAVRAHRHPERYGPRNVTGRPRQTRAAGIGRAMLETIPLVKFGETPPPKSTDIEMNGGSTTERDAAAATEGADADAPASGARKSTESTAARSTTTTKAEESGKHAVGMNHAQKVEKSLECAICWEDFEKGEEVRMLPCEHKFHPKCIDPWLLGFSGSCPVCRISFGQPGSSKEEQSSSEQHEGRSGGASGNGSGA